VEIVLRRIPGSEMLIPYAVNVPTEWGTGSMAAERIDVITTSAGKNCLYQLTVHHCEQCVAKRATNRTLVFNLKNAR
jgi:hypothetical protein